MLLWLLLLVVLLLVLLLISYSCFCCTLTNGAQHTQGAHECCFLRLERYAFSGFVITSCKTESIHYRTPIYNKNLVRKAGPRRISYSYLRMGAFYTTLVTSVSLGSDPILTEDSVRHILSGCFPRGEFVSLCLRVQF